MTSHTHISGSRMLRRTLTLVFLGCLVGCEAPTAARVPRVTLEMGPQSLNVDAGATLEAHDGDATVVTGHILLPGIPYGADASLQAGQGEWTVLVQARALTGCCADALNTRAYRLRITGPRRDGALLRVVHEYPATGWAPDTVFVGRMDPANSQRATP